MSFRFEWHEKKAVENHRKHRVTFQEALTVFADPLAAIFEDVGQPTGEQREIVVGRSERGRLLLVAFTERAPDTVRLISARQATPRERQDYEEGIHH